MRSAFGKKNRKLFEKIFCSHSLLEARCPSGPLFGKFLFLTYMGKMSTPSLPLPTGGKAAVWTKKGCCYPNLFLTDLSGQEKVSWPKESENRKKQPSHRKGSVIGLLNTDTFFIQIPNDILQSTDYVQKPGPLVGEIPALLIRLIVLDQKFRNIATMVCIAVDFSFCIYALNVIICI